MKKPVAKNRTARSRNFMARVYNLSFSLSSDKKRNLKRNNPQITQITRIFYD
jgi:hypothetical protein